MVLSDFRKNKLIFVFNSFFDVNKSGTIEAKDFELAIEKICRMRGYSKDDEKSKATQAVLNQIWKGLEDKADTDRDGQISHNEWCIMWDEFVQNPKEGVEWQELYKNFIFDLIDSSADGSIDEAEFSSVCTNFGISEAECKQAFQKFSNNGTVDVNRDEYTKLFKEFFSTDDAAARGNFIFGKVSFA